MLYRMSIVGSLKPGKVVIVQLAKVPKFRTVVTDFSAILIAALIQ